MTDHSATAHAIITAINERDFATVLANLDPQYEATCGTHHGMLNVPGERPVEPSGASLRLPMTLVLVFSGGKLRTERLCFDQLTMLRQVGGGRAELPFPAVGRGVGASWLSAVADRARGRGGILQSKTMTLSDGRVLSWTELGADSAATVLVHQHGTGSSRLELASRSEDFAALDVRMIAPERPGYGRSTALNDAWSTIDWANDVAALVDELDIRTFAVSGYSGGGAFALGIAASPVLGSRVSRVLLRASLAPDQGPRTAHDVEIRERAGRVPWTEYERWYESRNDELRLARADEEAFADPKFAEAAMATLAEGSSQGSLGDAADQWAFATPWGFQLTSIDQPVAIWHGDADTVVPISHAHTLLAALPNASLRVCTDDGHFSISLRAGEQAALIVSDPNLSDRSRA